MTGGIPLFLIFGALILIKAQLESRLYLPPNQDASRLYLPPKQFDSSGKVKLKPIEETKDYNFLAPPTPSNIQKPRAPTVCNPPLNDLLSRYFWRPSKKDDVVYPVLSYARKAPTDYVAENTNQQVCDKPNFGAKAGDCVYAQWSVDKSVVDFHSYDGCNFRTSSFNCEPLDGYSLNLKCVTSTGESLKVYGVKSDNHTWSLGYECWDNPVVPVSWSMFSLYKTEKIPDSLKREVLDYIETLGFDRSDYQEPSYDHCPNLENDPMLTTPVPPRVIDGAERRRPTACSRPEKILPAGSWHPDKKDDALYLVLHYAEQESLVDSAEATGKVGSCDKPLPRGQKNCITSKFDTGKQTTTRINYDGCKLLTREVQCTAPNPELAILDCDYKTFRRTSYHVWGDNHTYFLSYACVRDSKEERSPVTWALFSVFKTIPESLKQDVLDYVSTYLGFDKLDYRQPTYDHCPNFDQ